MKTFAVALLATVAQAQEAYYYKWSPETPVATAFKFPENIPVPFQATNEPKGNAGYQYQFTPEQPNSRPFKAPEDYTPVDFKYQYVIKPSDNFKYKYQPTPGEFDFTATPNPDMMDLTPAEIKAKSANVASSVRDVGALLSAVKSDDIKAITGELGFGQDFDLAGVSGGINKIGDFIEKGGEAGAAIATDIGSSSSIPKASPQVTESSDAPWPISIAAYLGFPQGSFIPIGRPIVYLFD